MDIALFIGNDLTLEVAGVQDEITGEVFAAAVVTATILDSSGQEVGPEISLQYVLPQDDAEGREGLYLGNIDDELDLEEGAIYTIKIVADAGGGLKARWYRSVPAQYRTF